MHMQERRKDLVKQVNKYSEEAKVRSCTLFVQVLFKNVMRAGKRDAYLLTMSFLFMFWQLGSTYNSSLT